jgi:nucleoside-diphosphate-sugar epimerase
MKVLVTGATGFLGKAIVKEFSQNGVDVISLSKSSKQFQADVTDENSLEKLKVFKHIDLIIHSAGLAHQFGKTPRKKFFDVNVKGTENLLNLAKSLQTNHFILISSVAVYGENRKLKTANEKFQEDSECNPIGDYAESKYEAELFAAKFCQANKINLTILRPATIIGEGDIGNVSRLITLVRNKRFFWVGKGENLKSLVDKSDVAKVCHLVSQIHPTGVKTYNITAKPIKMSEIVEVIAEELNVKIPKIYIPNVIAKLAGAFVSTIKKWISDDVFSGKKLKNDFGIEILSDIKESIRREVRSLEN